MREDIERCRREQLRCADYIQNNEPSAERQGAELGLADWLMEEILRTEADSK